MKHIFFITLPLLAGCVGSASNPYTVETAHEASTYELCRSIGFLSYKNNNHEVYRLSNYIQENRTIALEECKALARDAFIFSKNANDNIDSYLESY